MTTYQLRGLTDPERLAARKSAIKSVKEHYNTEPQRDASRVVSEYPRAASLLIVALCMVLLLAGFTPSGIRLYVMGSNTFGQAVPYATAKALVGVATVLSAEVGQVVFSLALAILGGSRGSRRLLYSSMALATTIALTGNIQLAMPGHWYNPFAWLEAIAPPVLVLSTAYVLKEQLLMAIRQRHENERLYQMALAEWQRVNQDVTSHEMWPQVYANALRDALKRVNSRGANAKAIRAYMNTLDVEVWRQMVATEMSADSWFRLPQTQRQPVAIGETSARPLSAVASISSGNGSSSRIGHGR